MLLVTMLRQEATYHRVAGTFIDFSDDLLWKNKTEIDKDTAKNSTDIK